MNRFIRKRDDEEPTINLTPLIDVVFVVLIMFIVVAPLLELDRVELAESGPAMDDHSVSIKEASPISIHVHQNNQILFNNRPVKLEELPELLMQARRNHPQAKPQLFHDRRAQFGTYQSVKNSMESAGFREMEVILKPT